MNYVESLNLFGVEAKEIPCIKGSGVPTESTIGAVGLLYMDIVTGDIYKCTAENGNAYTWRNIGGGQNNASFGFNPENYLMPILYLTGDTTGISKENAVELNYNYEDMTGVCTLKWQGNSSLTYPKKNFTIKFDNAFEAHEGWGEQKKYCLKANYIDFTHSRNVVSAKLWGQIVKSRSPENATLSVLPNGGAVDGFPVILMLNDEFYGLYTFNIPKDGWMFGMSDSALQQAIVCADTPCDATNLVGMATLNGDFELEYVSDEENSGWVVESLNRMISAVMNSNGTDLDTTVAQYLDIDSAIDYLIFKTLVRGIDIGGKNYILATYDGVKWFFSAYDLDSTWGLNWDGSSLQSAKGLLFGDQTMRLDTLIRNYKKTELLARYKDIRNTVFSEDNISVMFSNWAMQISKIVQDNDAMRWPTLPGTTANTIAYILNWFRLRSATIDAELNISDTTAAYTNLVPTSVDPKTGEIYNVIGYKDGYIANGSDTVGNYDYPAVVGEEVTTTGLIDYVVPATGLPSTIYLKGVTMIDNADYCKMEVWKENKFASTFRVGKTTIYYTLEELGEQYYRMVPIADNDGRSPMVTNMGPGITKVRFTLPCYGESLIITLDEHIE